MTTSTRVATVRQLWLSYFNRVLREQGIITPEAYRKMTYRIYEHTR